MLDSQECIDFKYYILEIINGNIEEYDIEWLKFHTQVIFDSGSMSNETYDELMGYLSDLK